MMQKWNSNEAMRKAFHDADHAIEDKQLTISELQNQIDFLHREIDALDTLMMRIEEKWIDVNDCICGLEYIDCEGEHE